MDIAMSIFDFVPVALFLSSSIILMRLFHKKMNQHAFALFGAGTFNVFIAGFLKATYKLLGFGFGLNFDVLNKCFFPLQTIGFLMAGIGMLRYMMTAKNTETKIFSNAIPLFLLPLLATFKDNPEFKGTMIFVVLMVLGVALMYAGLIFYAVKEKKYYIIAILVVSFICVLGMGYLSTKDELSDWIKEFVNSIGQLTLFITALILYRNNKKKVEL